MGGEEFRRRYERKKYTADVVFSVEDRAFAGTLRDISMGGAFVLTISSTMVAKGDVIIMSIPYTTGKKNIKRRCRVLWTSAEGFAVEFI